MLGAIIGDLAGSFREFTGAEKYADLPLVPTKNQLPKEHKRGIGITDDSLLTLATARTILRVDRMPTIEDFSNTYWVIGNQFKDPIGGFGGGFKLWLTDETQAPYHSCGNGSAMRISPVGYAATTVDEVLTMAFNSACATHNHPEGIKGAQSVALAIYYARKGYDWEKIKSELKSKYLHYDPIIYLGKFDSLCQDTLRLAWGVLDITDSYESAVKYAVTIPYADSDTLGAIVGSIAEPLYGIPDSLKTQGLEYLKDETLHNIYLDFYKTYIGDYV